LRSDGKKWKNGGSSKNPALHTKVLDEMKTFFQSMELNVLGICESPLQGRQETRNFSSMQANPAGRKDKAKSPL